MKIILADDHTLFRSAFALMLKQIYGGDTEIVEAANYDEALAAVGANPDARLVLCDMMMPGMNAGAALKQIVATASATPIVIVSSYDDRRLVLETMNAGAKGYIVKDRSLEVLKTALDLILVGGSYVPADILFSPEDEDGVPGNGHTPALAGLTVREYAVLIDLKSGLSNKEIARHFGTSEGTIKVHVRSIFRKLGVKNRSQAAALATRLEATAPQRPGLPQA